MLNDTESCPSELVDHLALSKTSGTSDMNTPGRRLRGLNLLYKSDFAKLMMPDITQVREQRIPELMSLLSRFPKYLSLQTYLAHSSVVVEGHFQLFLAFGNQSDARDVFELSLGIACLTEHHDLMSIDNKTSPPFYIKAILAYLEDYPQDFTSALQAVAECGTSAVSFLLSVHGWKHLEDFYHHAQALQQIWLPYPKILFHVLSAVACNTAGQDDQEVIFATILESFRITPVVINEMKVFAKCSDIREYYYRCMVLHYIHYARFLGLNVVSDLYDSLDYRLAANVMFPHPFDYRMRILDLKFTRNAIGQSIQDGARSDNAASLLYHYPPYPFGEPKFDQIRTMDVPYQALSFMDSDGHPLPSIEVGKGFLGLWKFNSYKSEILAGATRHFEGVASGQYTTDKERQVARWWLAFIRSNPDPHAIDTDDLRLEVSVDINNERTESWNKRALDYVTLQWVHAAREGNILRLAQLLPLIQNTAAILDTNSDDFEFCMQIGSFSIMLTEWMETADIERLKPVHQELMSRFGKLLTVPVEQLRENAVSTDESSFSRLRFARDWAQRSFDENLPESVDAFQLYASLLQDNIPIASLAEYKHRVLTSEAWVRHWSDTAVTALVRHGGSDRLFLAVEFFEQSRSITYRHLFQLREGSVQLMDQYPDLERRRRHLSSTIRGAFQDRTRKVHETGNHFSHLQRTFRQLEQSHDELLKEIRGKPGFEGFLRPLKYDELSNVAAEGPVIMLSSDPKTELSHAIIILPHHEQLVYHQLPKEASFTELSRHSSDMAQALAGDGESTRRGWELDTNPSDKDSLNFQRILEWLWDHVVSPIFDTLHTAGYTSGRVWWCPSGNFTLLPLHAAAMLDPYHSIISSYTPSLEVLISSRRRAPASDDTTIPRRLAVVGLQSCPRRRELQLLYAVKEELGIFSEQDDKCQWMIDRTQLEGSAAQVESVLDAMKSSHIVHLACHGVQDSSDPLNSHLILHDNDLTLRTLMDADLPCAEFAFLSACQTATAHKELANESVHLAGGFIAAGFKGVVGTLWSIADNDAPRVARRVYDDMITQAGGIDIRKAAMGLHRAVQGMIKQGLPPRRWAPFIHVGI